MSPSRLQESDIPGHSSWVQCNAHQLRAAGSRPRFLFRENGHVRRRCIERRSRLANIATGMPVLWGNESITLEDPPGAASPTFDASACRDRLRRRRAVTTRLRLAVDAATALATAAPKVPKLALANEPFGANIGPDFDCSGADKYAGSRIEVVGSLQTQHGQH